MKGITHLLLLAMLLSCGKKEETLFAYGSFETTEVKLSSQTMGEVLSISKAEGMSFAAGEHMCCRDERERRRAPKPCSESFDVTVGHLR